MNLPESMDDDVSTLMVYELPFKTSKFNVVFPCTALSMGQFGNVLKYVVSFKKEIKQYKNVEFNDVISEFILESKDQDELDRFLGKEIELEVSGLDNQSEESHDGLSIHDEDNAHEEEVNESEKHVKNEIKQHEDNAFLSVTKQSEAQSKEQSKKQIQKDVIVDRKSEVEENYDQPQGKTDINLSKKQETPMQNLDFQDKNNQKQNQNQQNLSKNQTQEQQGHNSQKYEQQSLQNNKDLSEKMEPIPKQDVKVLKANPREETPRILKVDPINSSNVVDDSNIDSRPMATTLHQQPPAFPTFQIPQKQDLTNKQQKLTDKPANQKQMVSSINKDKQEQQVAQSIFDPPPPVQAQNSQQKTKVQQSHQDNNFFSMPPPVVQKQELVDTNYNQIQQQDKPETQDQNPKAQNSSQNQQAPPMIQETSDNSISDAPPDEEEDFNINQNKNQQNMQPQNNQKPPATSLDSKQQLNQADKKEKTGIFGMFKSKDDKKPNKKEEKVYQVDLTDTKPSRVWSKQYNQYVQVDKNGKEIPPPPDDEMPPMVQTSKPQAQNASQQLKSKTDAFPNLTQSAMLGKQNAQVNNQAVVGSMQLPPRVNMKSAQPVAQQNAEIFYQTPMNPNNQGQQMRQGKTEETPLVPQINDQQSQIPVMPGPDQADNGRQQQIPTDNQVQFFDISNDAEQVQPKPQKAKRANYKSAMQ